MLIIFHIRCLNSQYILLNVAGTIHLSEVTATEVILSI